MKLSQRFEADFSPAIRKRGEAYYRDGRVELEWTAADGAQALVHGSQVYETELWIDEEGLLGGGCDCAYAESEWENVGCKHMWATLLAWEDAQTGGGPSLRDARKRKPAKAIDWRKEIDQVNQSLVELHPEQGEGSQGGEQRLIYVIDSARSIRDTRGAVVEVMTSQRKRNGEWGKPQRRAIPAERAEALPDAADREIVGLLTGGRPMYGYYGGQYEYTLGTAIQRLLIERMCRTGRAYLRVDEQTLVELVWDDDEPWRLTLVLVAVEKRVRLVPQLRRGDASLDFDRVDLLTAGGLIFSGGKVAAFDDGGAFPWIVRLRFGEAIEAPASQAPALLGRLLAAPTALPIEAPNEWLPSVEVPTPAPRLTITPRGKRWQETNEQLLGDLSFAYGDRIAEAGGDAGGWYDEDSHRVVRRHASTEREAAQTLLRLGFKLAKPDYSERWSARPGRYSVPQKRLSAIVAELTAAGWHVEAEGKVFRRGTGSISVHVQSGIDWFDVHADAAFDGQDVPLPRLLEAMRKGERMVRLDDGTYGVMPEQWLAQLTQLTELGQTTVDGSIRFRRTQAALLDALLAAQPGADVDAAFDKVRKQLAQFDGVKPTDPPQSFTGILRPYQQQGLGWLAFCRDMGFGACLADDMGLGKTVQVLAMLEQRRLLRAQGDGEDRLPPSLAVVPRSLVHSWIDEATRFTPALRVLNHTGIERDGEGGHFDEHDLVITTYGTLRRDAAMLTQKRFDYAILDEAQAIKNPGTDSAKAARLIRADHRIAMSGTPIENHLGELWSLFEFLNPGMLGRSSAFKALTSSSAASPEQAADQRRLIASAVRPFVLRRTKQQVAADLPDRTEQTIECEMDAPQRKLYDELRDHYRAALLDRIDRQGVGRSKVQVLEALLRLRQAACHPGLIDKSRVAEPSAKLDTLLARLDEVADEDHKALVFSQFTSMLAIVRRRLDEAGVVYEYLDGRTRDRAARVQRFQSDPTCKLFLISLKAGGVGLNLTAADYVFLLDPWWNPAVEQQAIDRAHRIGQTRPVCAYRLIAPDTVEQKVLELQATKRDLADAIIAADKGPLAGLTREDIARLLE
jgi:hypothetical protein